eukprot:GHVT01099232.1.p1 GENE.GHVT01099232.1~~GHVT01099232.1.p1  ORF type:complete len:550 (+),score=111.01 GHVT01099232.1:57-1652(+)
MHKTFSFHCLRVAAKDTQYFIKDPRIKPLLLKRPRLRAVAADPDRPVDGRVIVLDVPADAHSRVPKTVMAAVEAAGAPVCHLGVHTVELTYDNLSTDAALRLCLPSGLTVPSSFEAIGHIAHLNLRTALLPWKRLIGRVIMDKNTSIRTVVNKVANLSNRFRTMDVECLAGTPDYEAIVKEESLVYHVNPTRVYWNSRLSSERKSVCTLVRGGDVICDCFAGAGAFAIPLARLGCLVFANDLNPAAKEYTDKNAKANKVSSRVLASTEDARDFCRRVALRLRVFDALCPPPKQLTPSCNPTCSSARADAESYTQSCQRDTATGCTVSLRETASVHFLMNLPELALEFLDVFPGLLASPLTPALEPRPPPQQQERLQQQEGEQRQAQADGQELLGQQQQPLPLEHQRHREASPLGLRKSFVHVWGFSRTTPPETDLKPRVVAALGCWPLGTTIHEVRDVAPNKRMFRLDIPLSAQLLLSPRPALNAEDSAAEATAAPLGSRPHAAKQEFVLPPAKRVQLQKSPSAPPPDSGS